MLLQKYLSLKPFHNVQCISTEIWHCCLTPPWKILQKKYSSFRLLMNTSWRQLKNPENVNSGEHGHYTPENMVIVSDGLYQFIYRVPWLYNHQMYDDQDDITYGTFTLLLTLAMSNFQGLAKALMKLAQNMQNMARVRGLLIMGPEQHCGSEFKGTRPPKESWISSLYRQHTSTIYIWDSQDLIPQVYLWLYRISINYQCTY